MNFSNDLVHDIRKLYSDFRILISRMENVPEIGVNFTPKEVLSLDTEYTLALGSVQSLWKNLGDILDAIDSGKYDANSPM